MEYIKQETKWLTASASTRFHLFEEGGLFEHSVNVAETVLKMKEVSGPY